MRVSSFVVLFAFAGGVCAQTPVAGPILTATTWSIAGSPYQVVGPVLIGGNATLTIQPGTVVEFTTTGRLITVGSAPLGAGTLVARGTAGQPVVFTSLAGAAGSWDKIHFTDYATDAVFDQTGIYQAGSVLEHCVIEFGGGGGVSGSVHVQQSSPWLVDTTVRASATDGIAATMSGGTQPTPALRIDRCSASSCAAIGFDISQGSNHAIAECSATACAGGISLSVSAATLDGCVVRSSTTWAGIAVSGGGNSVVDCLIEGNAGGGLWMSGGGAATDNVIVANSATTGAGVYASGGRLQLAGNLIAGNSASSQGGGIYGTFDSFGDTVCDNSAGSTGGGIYSSGASLTDTSVNGNRAATGAGIYCFTTTAIQGCAFVCNTASGDGGAVYYRSWTARTASLAGMPMTGQRNTFLGNAAARGEAVFNGLLFGQSGSGGAVDATYVCWGGGDPLLDLNLVYDFFDDPSLGIVNTLGPAVCDPLADAGAGSQGAAGVPALNATGTLLSGTPLTATLVGAAPDAPVGLIVGVGTGYAYVPSLTAVIVPDLNAGVVVPLIADAQGAASLTVPMLPPNLPVGVKTVLQAAVIDSTARNGLAAFSNAVIGYR